MTTATATTPIAASAPPPRRYASTYVVAALTTTALVLAIVPGNFHVASKQWTHGWPWTYMTRGYESPFLFQFSSFKYHPWNVTDEVIALNAWLLLANVAVGIAVIAMVSCGWHWWRRQRQRIYQFHIRDLLFLTGVSAVLCAWYVQVRRTWEEEQAVINRLPVLALYDSELPSWLVQWIDPACASRLVTDGTERVGLFDRVALVGASSSDLGDRGGLEQLIPLSRLESLDLEGRPANSDLADLKSFPALNNLLLDLPAITDTDLSHILQCRSLEKLQFNHVDITCETIQKLRQLPKLQSFRMAWCTLKDGVETELATLRQLRRLGIFYMPVPNLSFLDTLPRLECLEVAADQFRDDYMPSIARLRSLRFLSLVSTPVTDRGLQCLEAMPRLECLAVSLTSNGLVTKSGIEALKRSIPGLEVVEW